MPGDERRSTGAPARLRGGVLMRAMFLIYTAIIALGLAASTLLGILGV
jgi:hypothetical protein